MNELKQTYSLFENIKHIDEYWKEVVVLAQTWFIIWTRNLI